MSEVNNTPATDESIQDIGIPEISVSLSPSEVIQQATDATLTAQGQPADAKAVGDRFAEVEDDIANLGTDLSNLDGTVANAVLVTEQTLETEEQAQARENIGLGDAATYDVAPNLTTPTAGSKVLDAYQGKVLKDAIDDLDDDAVQVTSQIFTDAQKAQARTNIGALGASDITGLVSTAAQTLTDAQKTQARTNIDALGADADVVHYGSQSLTAAQKAQARANIDAKCLVVTGTMPTTGSVTISNTGITADMIVAEIYVATAGAVGGTWTWATADGSITLTGVCYTSTNVTIYLVHTA